VQELNFDRLRAKYIEREHIFKTCDRVIYIERVTLRGSYGSHRYK
jgi:hypothetical protein